MRMNDYQKEAQRTALLPDENELLCLVLGLNGEAGELAEQVKKSIRDDGTDGPINEARKERMIEELGDNLWYNSQIARYLGVDMEEVARRNLHKLQNRQKRGTIHGEGPR